VEVNDALMYVYCQAGYAPDALRLWRRALAPHCMPAPHAAGLAAGHPLRSQRTVASGLVKLLCLHGPMTPTRSADASVAAGGASGAVPRGEAAARRLGLGGLLEVLAAMGGTGAALVPGPVAKGFVALAARLADHADAPAGERLDAALAVLTSLGGLGVPPPRRAWPHLLRICCGPDRTAVHRAQEVFEKLEAAVAVTSGSAVVSGLGGSVASGAADANDDAARSPTRYEYTLLIAALEAAEPERTEKPSPAISAAVDAMRKAGLLPLSDVGIIRRAQDGDTAALNGALLVRALTGARSIGLLYTSRATNVVQCMSFSTGSSRNTV